MVNNQTKKLTLRERFKKAWTADNIVDLSVDIFLIVFDVLSSPILVVMRIVRWIINKFFINYIKAGVRGVVHWFQKHSARRKQLGYGFFRYWWWLILLSPAIIIIVWLAIAFMTGFKEGMV